MRSGLGVVITIIVLGLVLGGVAVWNTSRSALMVEDLFTALAYYAETHDGKLPAGPGELAASPFIEERADGALVVRPRDATRLRRRVYGRPIVDLARFNVRWGVDLSTLRIDPAGAVRSSGDAEIQLIAYGRNPDLGRRFSRDLLLFCHDAGVIPDPRRDPNIPTTQPVATAG